MGSQRWQEQQLLRAERSARFLRSLGVSEGVSGPLTPLGCVCGRDQPAGSKSHDTGGQELGGAGGPRGQFKPCEAAYNWPLGSTND